jgi:WD repeat-containing protein 70
LQEVVDSQNYKRSATPIATKNDHESGQKAATPEADGDRTPPPPTEDAKEQKRVSSVEEQNEAEYDPDGWNDSDEADFPISHEIVLKDHTKVISALSVDPSGARIVSGSHDYDCKLWDFGGMDHRCLPFHTWEPAGSYHVCASLLLFLSC